MIKGYNRNMEWVEAMKFSFLFASRNKFNFCLPYWIFPVKRI
jgi:hypothetical protein